MENFTSLTLSLPLVRAIADLGYEKPSPIQAQTLPILLGKPTDFIGLAATGTGKTAAFSIPMLEKLDPTKKFVQALIMCPTRELVLQVAGQVNLLGKHMGVQALPIYGGAGYDEQLRGLKRGAQVVVGTPGRMIDHIQRGTLKLDGVQIAVLDEADEMISMGFREDMETILSATSRETSNIWLFSATMSSMVRKVADQFLRDPQSVQVNRGEMLSSTVKQQFVMTQEKNKAEVLCKLIDAADEFYGLVFCQTKALVVELTKYMTERGYKADNLHGDKSQAAREVTLRDFRARRVQILVCTDVAARGLDVKDVTHVMNFSIPRELDNYVHRIGRTARSGKEGVAISLVTPSHRYLLNRIEKMTKSLFDEIQVPTRKALGTKKVAQAFVKLEAQNNFNRAVDLLDETMKATLSAMTSEEVAGRFLVMMHPEIFSEQMQVAMSRPQQEPRDRDMDRDSRPRRSSPRSSDRRPSYGSSYGGGSGGGSGGERRGGSGGGGGGGSYKRDVRSDDRDSRGPREDKPWSRPAKAASAVETEQPYPKFKPKAPRIDKVVTKEEASDRPRFKTDKPKAAAARPSSAQDSDGASDSKKTFRPYRAPRSEKANTVAKESKPVGRKGSLARAPGSKWQADNKSSKKKGGNYPPRRKVLGYSRDSSKVDKGS